MIKNEFRNVLLVENEKNLGFTKGNNIGAKKAKGEYLFFLNSDCQVIKSDIKGLIDLFGKDKNIAVVGGALKDLSVSIQKSWGTFYDIFWVFFTLFVGERLRPTMRSNSEVFETDWVMGACMITKADVFKKIGGFDENIFMYLEDMELCYRVKKLGLLVFCYPNFKVLHLGQGSSNRSFAIVHIYKGLLYFFRKHKSYLEYTIIKMLLIMKASFAIAVGMLTRNTYLLTTYKKALASII